MRWIQSIEPPRLADMIRCAFALLPGLLLFPLPAYAADYLAGPGEYRDWLPKLQAGDRLRLEPGDYLHGLPLHGLSGTVERPIVIEGANRQMPPRFVARQGANTVSLVDVRHVVIRHLELDGRNLPVDAIKAEGHSRFADFVTLENLYIHDHAASQQNVGISSKCPAFGWVVRGNRIERVGTGMYFGDSDGSDPFVAGLIEHNIVRETLGYSLQIKHQTARAENGPGAAGRHDTLIRHNLFTKRLTRGEHPRPNVLVGHFPASGPGSEDRYLIYNNLFLHNPDEALLQAEGRVAIYGNLFVNAHGNAIHVQPHHDVPRDMAIFSNTVLAQGTGIRIRQREDADYAQHVTANVVSAAAPIQGGTQAVNVRLPYQPELIDAAPENLTAGLLAKVRRLPGVPQHLLREWTAYPGWRGDDRRWAAGVPLPAEAAP